MPDPAALTAPGALFPMAGMRGAVEKLARIYAKAGLLERFRGVFHDEPHSFRSRMQDEAFAWLERWL